MKRLVLFTFLISLLLPLSAQEAKDAAQKTDSVAPPPKETEYQKLMKKSVSTREGMLTIHHIDKDWYFEIPESMLGRLMLTVSRFTNVPQEFSMMGGEEVQRNTVYFEKYNDKTMFLRHYANNYFPEDKSDISRLLQKASTDPISYKFDIAATNPDNGAYLVAVTKLFETDTKIGGIINNDRTQVKLGSLQSDRTMIDTIRTYAQNIEVSTLRTYSSTENTPAGLTGFVTLGLNTSIVLLPEVPMQARLADERVGYFQDKITRFYDDEPSRQDAIISRYRLVPKDKKAYARGQLVEPEKPIVYYIDPATPKKWVKYLIQGVNDWNVAFEAAGFKNAIIAKEWPNDPTMSVDDSRYCVIRYLPSTKENAYGPRIVDPRSGEILESHICWYHNVMNLVRKWYVTQCGPLDKRAQKADLDDELMGQLIRFVSSHEVGHTLGLRHNMIASSATPVEKLRDKAWVEAHGHTASIMDYARFNYVAQPEDKIGPKGLFPRINDYDKWAIKWGYQYRPEFDDPYAEQKVLRSEVTAALKGNVRLRYCGDEGKGSDPRSQSEDLGDDAVKASEYGIKNLKRVMENLEDWTRQPDDLYDDLSNYHKRVRVQFQLYIGHVQKNINGVYTNNTPGDERKQIVPKSKQKAAVKWVGDYVMGSQLWLYPSSIVSKLGFDAEDEMHNRRMTSISYLLSPGMLYNSLRNSYVTSTERYPLEEYLSDVFHAVWRPMSKTSDRENFYQRENERMYIDFLRKLVVPTEKDLNAGGHNANRSDAVLYAIQHLDMVEDYCTKQNAAFPSGSITQLHYANILQQIKNMRSELNSSKNINE